MRLTLTHRLLLITAFSLILMSFSYEIGRKNRPSTKIYKGYVITESGEKIHGKLQMLSPAMNQVKVKFIDKDGKKSTYKAKDIASYAFQIQEWDKIEKKNIIKWIHYTKKTVERPPVPFASTSVLLQREVNGAISIYNYYIETRASQNMEHFTYLEKDGVLYTLKKNNYRKILKTLTADFPVVYHKIGTKGYTYKHVPKLISEYNKQVSKKGEATISFDEVEE